MAMFAIGSVVSRVAFLCSQATRQSSVCFAAFCLAMALPSMAHAQYPYGLRVTDLRDGVQVAPGQANPPVASLRRLIRIEWAQSPSGATNPPSGAPGPGQPTSVGGGVSWYGIERNPTNSAFPRSSSAPLFYEDNDWTYNTTYTYSLVGYSWTWNWNSTANQWQAASVPWSYPVPVTVRRIPAVAAQTVDTRIDPRFSTYQLKNFKFRDDKYRGGLFAGYNADGSKVARTYLKFASLGAPPVAGQQLWNVGGLSLYLTRTAQASQSVALRSRFVVDDTWVPESLVWGNAPAFKASGGDAVSLSWATGTAGRWVTMNILPDLDQTFTHNGGDGTLSVALSVPSESNGGTSATFPIQATSGWAYFARNGYEQDGLTDIQPYLLYAFGGIGVDIASVGVQLVYNNSTMPPTLVPMPSNSSRQGTINLASAAPPGGVTITLSSSAAYVTVPASVTIAAGQTTANFNVASGTIPSSGNVTISATLGKTVTTSVAVAP